MVEQNTIPIRELMQETESFLLSRGYSKGTIGTYKVTWNRYLAFSTSANYERSTAELFLKKQYGVDVTSSLQQLDMRMRHARRHMNALHDYYLSGSVERKHMRCKGNFSAERFRILFGDYLAYCKQQNYSDSWFSNTESALYLFMNALNDTNISDISEINAQTIERFSALVLENPNYCQNTRRSRIKSVAVYLEWAHNQHLLEDDYKNLLPDIKRTPQMLPEVWSEEDIQKLLDVIDISNPTGKRNYAIFLLLARTGLRIGDIISLRFGNIDWHKNCIHIVQQKTGKPLSVPISAEIGMAIISYLKYGRPNSDEDVVFLSHNAPFQPLNIHNNFHPEMRKYMRIARVDFKGKRHSGVHTLRSSFATNLLKKGASLENISQALGHSNINVATSYLRVDVENLRICALGLEVAK